MSRFAVALFLVNLVSLAMPLLLVAEVGDPQIRSDHPWYPGELAISSFERLAKTQAQVYERVTGQRVETDEQKALASWLWRNTHYWHGENGRRDLWGQGFNKGRDMRNREYWNGLFGYGFGLCGTTHSQWTAEFNHLLGHNRGRGVGAAGHNAFEVFLQGGAYGSGRWALLDHDLSTVIFDESGKRLVGLGEMQSDVDRWINRGYKPDRQRGWLVCGLHPGDGASYRKYAVAEYLAGYAGPLPMVHLRRGERFRRYFEPGLEDGKTFVFWGRNYNTRSIPGPERSRTWVNQPDRMFGSKTGTPHRDGQARFANAEYLYRPNFSNGDYREGLIKEDGNQVVFEFRTPYVIGATPPNDKAWGIYDAGCRNGLVLRGRVKCNVSVSANAGRTWSDAVAFQDGLDLTDHVKGRSQYWLRFDVAAQKLEKSDLRIRTVCQANIGVLPRLKDGGATIQYAASDARIESLGPELDLAQTFVSEGAFGQKSVTMSVTPRRAVMKLHAAAHVASGSPPNKAVRYGIEFSLDAGRRWHPLVKNWTVPRRGDEPADFWSQSFCYGSASITSAAQKPIMIRFANDGGKRYLRGEVHLVEQVAKSDPLQVTYHWSDSEGLHTQSHRFTPNASPWRIPTGRDVKTKWVEMVPHAARGSIPE